jgi:hypothetical protein
VNERTGYGSVSGRRSGRWARRGLYWLAVIAVSMALVVVVLMLLQPYDGSTVGAVAPGGE